MNQVKMKISNGNFLFDGKTSIYHKDIEPAIRGLEAEVKNHKSRLYQLEHGCTEWLEEFRSVIELETYINMLKHILGV